MVLRYRPTPPYLLIKLGYLALLAYQDKTNVGTVLEFSRFIFAARIILSEEQANQKVISSKWNSFFQFPYLKRLISF